MQYMGSKNRIADLLLPIILKDRKPEQWYVEPFMGGANMIDKVGGLRMGNDLNHYIVALLEAVSKGWEPPSNITKEIYKEVKNNKDNYPPKMVGYVGLCSYRGVFFSSYDGGGFQGHPNPAWVLIKKALSEQAPNLKGIEFASGSYLDLKIPPKSIIYCDPPYQGVGGYGPKFDHNQFWQWCRDKAIEGHQVFISEYQAPADFRCLTEINLATQLGSRPRFSVKTEKLFSQTSDYKEPEQLSLI